MSSDIHMTTCHHTSLKCRPRTNDYNIEGWNITAWTQSEKLNIAKQSLASLNQFAKQKISIVDDGSDYTYANLWLQECISKFNTYSFSRSNENALNKYIKFIDDDVDLIAHFEDDHVYFNPENLNWQQIAYDFLTSNKDIGSLSFISGLPNRPEFPDYKGAWGPISFRDREIPALLYKRLGNSHHIMLKDTYLKFFPLIGKSGTCEAYMCNKLSELGLLHAEIQVPIYAFHSHCFKRELPKNVTTTELNMSARGREYGIKDMYDHINNNKRIEYSYLTCSGEVFKKWGL